MLYNYNSLKKYLQHNVINKIKAYIKNKQETKSKFN